MVTYQQEFLSQVKDDIVPLLMLDWQEIEHRKSIRKLDPDWDAYYGLEDAGILRIFTARDGEKLIGYFVSTMTPSLHCKGVIQALADVIFLLPEYRRGMTALKLFKFAEKCLRDDGVHVLHVTTTEVNKIDAMMFRLGYSKTEATFERVL